MQDEAGLCDYKIVASYSLDERLINDLIMQGDKIDILGVGERLITEKSDPVFGGVYKLVAVENDQGQIIPKIFLEDINFVCDGGLNANQLLLHSDQGLQYTSHAYFSLTKEYGTPSMSRRGNCYDNAMAENFLFHSQI